MSAPRIEIADVVLRHDGAFWIVEGQGDGEEYVASSDAGASFAFFVGRVYAVLMTRGEYEEGSLDRELLDVLSLGRMGKLPDQQKGR